MIEAIKWKIVQFQLEEQKGRELLQRLHSIPVPEELKKVLAMPIQVKIRSIEEATEALEQMNNLIQQMEEDMRRSRP